MVECRNITVMDRVIAFLNLFDNDCRQCLRRSSYTCSSCRATTARSILLQIRAERMRNGDDSEVDYSLYARIAVILKRLSVADRPLRSVEIDLSNVSPQLKAWTLLRMIRRGTIGRRRSGNYYVYFLTKKIKKGRVK